MTISSYTKMHRQLRSKPLRLKKYNKHNKPKERTTGKSLKKCQRCGNVRGLISKYNLSLCRRCFRQIAPKIGFTKFS